jgi:uncharacterized protein involved in outer membrane biogenesis
MKKWILIGAGVVIVIIVLLLVIGISKIGPLIKTAVNTYGPGITKTDLRLQDVGVSLFSGEVKLKEFYLGNPKGFTSPQAMKVKSIFVNVDEKSLLKDPIVIDKIEIAGPEITYEKTAGTDNFMTIMDNVKRSAGMGEPSKDKPKEGGKSKNLLIKDFVLKDGKVTLVAAFLGGRSISAPLPDIHLTNIGGGKDGVSPAKASEAILAALYERITSSAVTASLNNQLKALGMKGLEEAAAGVKKQLDTTFGTKTGEEAGKLLDKTKGLFGK